MKREHSNRTHRVTLRLTEEEYKKLNVIGKVALVEN